MVSLSLLFYVSLLSEGESLPFSLSLSLYHLTAPQHSTAAPWHHNTAAPQHPTTAQSTTAPHHRTKGPQHHTVPHNTTAAQHSTTLQHHTPAPLRTTGPFLFFHYIFINISIENGTTPSRRERDRRERNKSLVLKNMITVKTVSST